MTILQVKNYANIRIQKSHSNIRMKCEYSNIRIFVDIPKNFQWVNHTTSVQICISFILLILSLICLQVLQYKSLEDCLYQAPKATYLFLCIFTSFFLCAKTKAQLSCIVAAQLIRIYAFATKLHGLHNPSSS